MSKQFAWSFTALDTYENCPRRYFLTKVKKSVVEPQSEQMLHGNEVHKALELYLKRKQVLPEKYAAYAPYADAIRNQPGKLLVEKKVALNRNLQETGYFDSDVWVRGVFDVALLRTTDGAMADWKTGRPKPNSDQMRLFAAMGFSLFPYLTKFDTAFVWLAHKQLDVETFVREQVPGIWEDFIQRVRRIEDSLEKDRFLPRQSGLCGWCPVGPDNCEFWKGYRGENSR